MTLVRTRSDNRMWMVLSLLIVLCASQEALAQTDATTQHPAGKGSAVQPAAGSTTTVTGSGTAGQLTKWTSINTLGDSSISEDKFGKVGIGATSPASKLTVGGVIETTSGGVKFPDGTVRATAAVTATGPMLVRDVDNPARQPFQITLIGLAPSNQFTVPSGKRLVIEYVSGRIPAGLGQQLETVRLLTAVNDATSLHFFTPIFTGGVIESIFTVSQQTRIYADPETLVIVNAEGGGPVLSKMLLTISGYLVDVQ